MRDAGFQASRLATVLATRWRDRQKYIRPLRARERPFVLVPPFELVAALADGDLDRRLVHHAVVDTLQPKIEKAHLICPPFLRIERMHVAAGVDAQLLMLRGARIRLRCCRADAGRSRSNCRPNSIGTVILSHWACAPEKAPLSRLWLSQSRSVFTCQASGRCCDARPSVWCNRCAVNQLVMNRLRFRHGRARRGRCRQSLPRE